MTDGKGDGAAFKEAYASLNAAQKEAVDTIEGPVMVIAGPGTGKTQVLTLRIANILLKTDVAPENILALTFTESGARAMRERLRSYIGAEAYRVAIHTFHGFAEECIKNYPDAYERVIGGRPVTDLERISYIETILESVKTPSLRPIGNPVYYIPHILRALDEMKREYIRPDDLAKHIARMEETLSSMDKIHEKGAHKGKVRGDYTKFEKSVIKNRELLHVYRTYEAALGADNRYDFADMLIETVAALRDNEDMLRDIQETYQYVLADEHQDVNGTQNAILELIVSYHDRPNLFVVGDEKQAIYRFQGASLENFLYFGDTYKDTKTIALTENYRSGQEILNASHELIRTDSGPSAELRVPLTAVKEGKSEVSLFEYEAEVLEEHSLTERIKAQLSEGKEPNEIAVILRTNVEVERMTALIRSAGIEAEASADGDILHAPITREVRALIAAVAEPENERALFEILHAPYFGLSMADVVRIVGARRLDTPLIAILSDEKKLTELGVENKDSARQVLSVLEKARHLTSTAPPHQVLECLINETGLRDHVIANDALEGQRIIRRIYDEVERLVSEGEAQTLGDITRVFDQLESHKLELTAPFLKGGGSAVQVMTAHKAKGLEFDVVFVAHAHDSRWSPGRHRSYFDLPLLEHLDESTLDKSDDERRLLYVAMTRAREKLIITYANENSDGREQIMSRLLEPLVEFGLEPSQDTVHIETFSPLIGLEGKQAGINILSKDFLTKLVQERGFSATSFNNYCNSPWDYFYRNLLRIPEVQPEYLLYGTALHNVMEYTTAQHTKEGKLPALSAVSNVLKRELGKLPITEAAFARLHEKGLASLTIYLEHIAAALPKETKEEFRLRVILPTGLPELPEIPLSGMLDRLDLDEAGRVVQVVDYKTGKPKTRNAIEGNTASSDGAYKRQLVFYALLLSLLEDERYECRDCVLSFIEPDSKGRIHEELFAITDEEITNLKADLITAIKNLITGEFLNEACDPGVSDYCELASKLKTS